MMKRVFLLFLMICLWLNAMGVYAAPIYQETNSLLPQCEDIKETVLRVELNRNIQDFLTSETNFDFGEIIERQWRVLDLDGVIDAEIDRAIEKVNSNAGLINRFKSSWLPSKAEELTNEVIEIAFSSSLLQNKLNQLSSNVAQELSDKLELISVQSSSYAMDCLQKFINRQYSQTFVNIFSKKINYSVSKSDQFISSLNPDTVSFFNSHKFAFEGAALFAVAEITKRLITKKIIGRITQQITERILGRIGTNVIPIIGEVVGSGMIAFDLIKSFDGALPEIQKSLKEPIVKENLQQEIIHKLEEELRSESYQIAREIANDIYAKWLDFQKDYRDTLTLAGELPGFKQILAQNQNIAKITSLVGIALNNMGRNQLVASIEDGTFERTLSLPDISYKMIETTHDLSTLRDWANLAGNQIEAVVALELYKHLSPQDLDRKLLLEILSLQDPATIAKLELLEVDTIRRLLTISKPNLLALTTNLSAEDMERLAGYLQALKQPQINQLVKFLLNDDTSIIQNNQVMTHIIQGRDINAAIIFWESKINNPWLILNQIGNLYTGVISWQLFVDKYGIPLIVFVIISPIIILGLLLLAIVLWFYRQLLEIKQKKNEIELNSGESKDK